VVARRVLADNVGSRRALERSGFAVDEIAGRYVAYTLTAPDGD
jgi:RimJ/RimL family protein N-acetyltransferase